MSKEQRKKPGRKAPIAPVTNGTALLQVQIRDKEKGKKTSGNGGDGGAKRLRYSHLLEEMVGCGDMVLLEPLTEENLLQNLKTRYENGEIYVSCRRRGRRYRVQ